MECTKRSSVADERKRKRGGVQALMHGYDMVTS